jgi:hypothetical protein
MPEQTTILGNHYHHIINGGLSISVSRTTDSEDGHFWNGIKINYSHHGNSATIECWEITPDALLAFAEALKTAAEQMKKDATSRS